MRRSFFLALASLSAFLNLQFSFCNLQLPAAASFAQSPAPSNNVTLFENVRIFDGKSPALADLLLIDVNPFEDIALRADPERNIVVIMKDGVIAKNKVD